MVIPSLEGDGFFIHFNGIRDHGHLSKKKIWLREITFTCHTMKKWFFHIKASSREYQNKLFHTEILTNMRIFSGCESLENLFHQESTRKDSRLKIFGYISYIRCWTIAPCAMVVYILITTTTYVYRCKRSDVSFHVSLLEIQRCRNNKLHVCNSVM